MDNSIDSRSIWDLASKAGLVLGGVSVAYMAITQLCMPSSDKVGMSMLISILSFVLWIAKFLGCIYLMKFFMRKLVADRPDSTNSDTFKLGVVTALLSAVIYSAFYLLYTTVISPDTFAEAMDVVQEAYGNVLPQESIDSLSEMNLPRMAFFANLIYCFLFGTVLSAILSRNIPDTDPFADLNKQDTDQQ